MRFLKSLFVLLVLVMFVACGDDDSNFASRGDDIESSSSSSSVRSSSSSRGEVPKAVPCKTDSTDDCVYGTLVDERDGQEYKTIDIAGRTWMAENLNYAYLDGSDSGSVCYDNDPENCEKYGRLYRWDVAVKVCPSGWHLTDTLEWHDLEEATGPARMLLSTYDWNYDNNGSDDFGFTVLPAGAYRDEFGGFTDMNDCTFYWTSTRFTGNPFAQDQISNILFDDRWDMVRGYGPRTKNKFSVRCVKD